MQQPYPTSRLKKRINLRQFTYVIMQMIFIGKIIFITKKEFGFFLFALLVLFHLKNINTYTEINPGSFLGSIVL